MKKFLIIAISMTLSSTVGISAQSPYRVWVECDTVGLIGDPFEIRLNAEGKDVSRIQFPILQGEFCPGLEILPTDTLATKTVQTENGNMIRTDTYRFSGYEEGLFKVPSFTFRLTLDNQQQDLYSDSTYIRLFEPIIDTTQAIKDIRTIAHVSGKELWKEYSRIYGKWGLLLLVVAALVIFLIYWRKRHKASLPLFKPAPVPIDPLENAFRQLSILKEKELWQKNLTKEYYTELTDILREFLSVEKNIPATEMTNDELCEIIPSILKKEPSLGKELSQTLQLATLAKFAKATPLPEDNMNSFTSVMKFFKLQQRERDEEKMKKEEEAPKN